MAYPRKLDNWDPMAESYHDANVNSYENGPGVNLTPFARSSADQEYKLYVKEIPFELSEIGIRQVFNRYGKTLYVMSPPNSEWAYVTYGSFREAETAIRELNNKPPLNLSVGFAIKKGTECRTKTTNKRHGIPNIEPVPPSSHNAHVGMNPVSFDNQCGIRGEYINPEQQQQQQQHLIHQMNRPPVRNFGRGQEFAALARRGIAPNPGPFYNPYDDLLYPAIHDPNLYDPYEDDEPFPETNNLWARGKLQVSSDGTRFVTMGRGSTWYELPNPHPRVHEQIRSVYENREAGLYEYGENKLSQQIGKCQNCAQTATMRCERCKEFYCSRICQENDWPRHKIECQIVPGLEGIPDSASLSISSGEELQQQQQQQLPMKRSVRKLRRPLQPAASLNVPNSTSTPLPGGSPMPEIPPAALPESILKPEEKENGASAVPSQNHNFKRNHTGDEKESFDHNKTQNAGGWRPMKYTNDVQPLRGCKNENRTGGIQNSNQMMNRNEKMPPPPLMREDTRNQNSNRLNKSNESQNQQTAAVEPNKNFFKRPNQSEKKKDDQQITEEVKKLDISGKEIPKTGRKPLLADPDVSFHRPRATHVTVENGKSPPKVSFGGIKREIEPIAGPSGIQNRAPASKAGGIEDKTKAGDKTGDKTKAAVKTEVKTKASPPAAVSSPPKTEGVKTIVELLEDDEEGCLEVHVLLGGNKAAVTICVWKLEEEYKKIVSELTPECEKAPKPSSFKSEMGDFVCGKRNDDWIRGRIVSPRNPIRLEAVDEGRVEPVTELKPIPQSFMNLPTFGAICEVTEADFKLEAMTQYTFMVLSKNSDNNNVSKNEGIEIVLFSPEDKEGKALLKPWKPAPEQKGIPYATLRSGTEICIASFRSHVLLFARSLVNEDLEIYNRLIQDVARCSTKSDKLTELPLIGEMVIAKYAEDGNYYRAIVRKIVDTKITVSYADFGNIETTTIDNLKPMNDKLKEYPSCAAKIMLKDVPRDIAMTKEAHDYLGMLAGTEKPLMCRFEGSPWTDGVVLKEADGTCVNKKIVELLTPSWKKEEDKTSVFMINDLEVAELGAVGDEIHVITLFSYGALLHAMAPQDKELIEHIDTVMGMQMKEYCEQLKDNYIPRVLELCLAPYKGSWYRAVCLDPNTTGTTASVNFVDWGNIEVVSHTDLRLMTKDFMSTKTLASVCTVVGLGEDYPEGELPKNVADRVEELISSGGPALIKIVKRTKAGEYDIELPEIKETLLKEGLIN